MLFQVPTRQSASSRPLNRVLNMTSAEAWKTQFFDWPDTIPRRGILLTVLNESMPFKNFWLNGDMLLLERTTPDALGGRFIILSLDIVNSLKFIDPISEASIAEAGFVGQLAPV